MMTNTELVEKAERLIGGMSVEVDDVRFRMIETPDNACCCDVCELFDLCRPSGSYIWDLCMYVDDLVDYWFSFELVRAY